MCLAIAIMVCVLNLNHAMTLLPYPYCRVLVLLIRLMLGNRILSLNYDQPYTHFGKSEVLTQPQSVTKAGRPVQDHRVQNVSSRHHASCQNVTQFTGWRATQASPVNSGNAAVLDLEVISHKNEHHSIILWRDKFARGHNSPVHSFVMCI